MISLNQTFRGGRILLLSFAPFYACLAQADTEFWFVVPQVMEDRDRPIFLSFSTYDKPSDITVVQPARQGFEIARISVPANTTYTLDITDHIDSLETLPATIMKTGVRISSSEAITAYYEVAGAGAGFLSLKGKNALGSEFIIPAQNHYHTGEDALFRSQPISSFDVVATNDNTLVKVWPTKPIYGHLLDSVITVRLNAGETYSFCKPTLSAQDNPGGTLVRSSKPIAITIKDDQAFNNDAPESCNGFHDLLADQLVPVSVTGMHYIVMKGFLESPEYVFITATENNTGIFINGNSTADTTLSHGQIYKHEITGKSTYITSSNPIAVFHVTGYFCEMGGAILLPIDCDNSLQIGFTRRNPDQSSLYAKFFGLNILVEKSGIAHFKLNGSAALIPPSAFTAVPGTNDGWYTAQLTFGFEGECRVTNDLHSFQLGVINGNDGWTCQYGFLSTFGPLFIGDDADFCQGEVATLDAGPGKTSYLWSTGETSQKIDVTTSGDYWVTTQRGGCVSSDTIKLSFNQGQLDLGADIMICPGDSTQIDGKENFSWLWSDGSTGQFLKTNKPGKYWASVHDNAGCVNADTIMVTLKDLPDEYLGEDILKCKADEVKLDATPADASYVWQDGNTSSSRYVSQEGLYWVKVTRDECFTTDTIMVKNYPGPLQDSIFGSPSVCPFVEDVDYSVEGIQGSSYQWFVEGGMIDITNENAVKIDWYGTNRNGSVQALVTDSHGCRGDTLVYPVRINVVLLAEIPDGPDTLCLNKSQQVIYSTPFTNGSVYQWNISGGQITSGQGTDQVTINWTEGLHHLWIDETSTTIDTVCFGTSPKLSVYIFRDAADIILNFVSIDTASANVVDVNWSVNSPERVRNGKIYLHSRTEGSVDWQLIEFSPHSVSYKDQRDVTTPEAVYEYELSLTNLCDEPVSTAVHNTMFLSGMADTTGLIALHWNHYLRWPHGVNHYEVWRRTDGEGGYRFLKTVPAHENTFGEKLAFDAFKHRYVIRAVQKAGNYESWSTRLDFDFEHPVEIPNIITPNGDPFNQYFEITNIQLYRNSVLTIIDRWGREVFRTVNYHNDWDGAGLSSGVYFYVLELKKNNKVFKGTLTIF